MMRKLMFFFGKNILVAFALAMVSSCEGTEPKTINKVSQETISLKSEGLTKEPIRAISLRVLQEITKNCMAKGTCSEDILQLAGIKKVKGYVIDEKNRDIVLIGMIDDTAPPLYLEDFVIALRNTWLKYSELKGNTYLYSSPGCSIDPNPNVLNELQQAGNQILSSSNMDSVQGNLKQWHNVCQQPQQVRVLGIPYDTRFGKVMVEADYYMKRLVDGSVDLDIDGFKSLTDMTLDTIRKDIENGRQISIPLQTFNRFWFYPGKNSFLEDKGGIYIEKSDVILLNEEEFLNKKGELAGTGRPNPIADKFTKNFSASYAEIAKRTQIYAELEGLFRFVALARIMKHKDAVSEAGISLDYLLNQYPVKITVVQRTLPGISNIKSLLQKY